MYNMDSFWGDFLNLPIIPSNTRIIRGFFAVASLLSK
jgi:hypothetical protein